MLDLPQTTTIIDNESRACGGDRITAHAGPRGVLQRLVRASSASSVGDDEMRDQADASASAASYLDDLSRQAQRLPRRAGRGRPRCPRSGSSRCAATPLQMAMVGAGIANDGIVMKPYLVDEIRSHPTSTSSAKTTPTEPRPGDARADRERAAPR